MKLVCGDLLSARIPVGGQLPDQLVGRCKLLLAAQPVHEMYVEFPVIELALSIEEMHFDRPRPAGLERRSDADVRHPVPLLAVEIGGDEIDSVGRNKLLPVVGADVGGRKADCRSPSIPICCDMRAGFTWPIRALIPAPFSNISVTEIFNPRYATQSLPPIDFLISGMTDCGV